MSAPRLVLQKVFASDAGVRVADVPRVFQRAWRPAVDVQLATGARALEAGQHEVQLKVTVTARLEDAEAFTVEVQQCGLFRLEGTDGDEARRRVLGVDAPAILFPFAREAVSELVQRAGFPQLLLQPVDFAALYREHAARPAAAGTRTH